MASKGINKVILIGNLGNEPDVRVTADGRTITTVSLATSDSWKDKSTGQVQEKTEWHRIVFLGGVAGVAGEFLHKGSQIYIEGKLQTRKWLGKTGQECFITEIVVDSFSGVMQMLDYRQIGDNVQPVMKVQPASNSFDDIPSTPFELDDFDDLPFG